MTTEPCRCGWVPPGDALYVAYHDEEWGVPLRDARRLFALLLLEGAQAGLSWRTVLYKRARYHEVFDDFDAERIARYDEAKVAALLADPGIIRNRAKVAAFIANARAWCALQQAGEDPVRWLWSFVGGEPRRNAWATLAEVPAASDEARAMSRALQTRGFKFVGPTICYAFMQSSGMVNDHLVSCFRYREISIDGVIGEPPP